MFLFYKLASLSSTYFSPASFTKFLNFNLFQIVWNYKRPVKSLYAFSGSREVTKLFKKTPNSKSVFRVVTLLRKREVSIRPPRLNNLWSRSSFWRLALTIRGNSWDLLGTPFNKAGTCYTDKFLLNRPLSNFKASRIKKRTLRTLRTSRVSFFLLSIFKSKLLRHIPLQVSLGDIRGVNATESSPQLRLYGSRSKVNRPNPYMFLFVKPVKRGGRLGLLTHFFFKTRLLYLSRFKITRGLDKPVRNTRSVKLMTLVSKSPWLYKWISYPTILNTISISRKIPLKKLRWKLKFFSSFRIPRFLRVCFLPKLTVVNYLAGNRREVLSRVYRSRLMFNPKLSVLLKRYMVKKKAGLPTISNNKTFAQRRKSCNFDGMGIQPIHNFNTGFRSLGTRESGMFSITTTFLAKKGKFWYKNYRNFGKCFVTFMRPIREDFYFLNIKRIGGIRLGNLKSFESNTKSVNLISEYRNWRGVKKFVFWRNCPDTGLNQKRRTFGTAFKSFFNTAFGTSLYHYVSCLPYTFPHSYSCLNAFIYPIKLETKRAISKTTTTLDQQGKIRLYTRFYTGFNRTLFFYVYLYRSRRVTFDPISSHVNFFKRKYSFVNTLVLKRHILRKLSREGFYLRDFLNLNLWNKRPHNDLTNNLFSKNVTASSNTPLHFFLAKDATNPEHLKKMRFPIGRILRIRFKPGYSRQWRFFRSDLKEFLGITTRYQYRLSILLERIYVKDRQVNELNLQLSLLPFTVQTQLVPDFWSAEEIFKANWLFINGWVCRNKNLTLLLNDFLQLIVSLKYYITIKWLLSWSVKNRFRVTKLNSKWSKKKPSFYGKSVRQRLPNWLFTLKYSFYDVPKYTEVDFFTLSSFVILPPGSTSNVTVDLNYKSQSKVFNLYNWKYIT